MKTRIGIPHTRGNRPHALPLHGHRRAAPGPAFGTALQLQSSYANRNNRNSFSYEKTFLSYDRVPTPSYGSTSRNPAGPAFSSPDLSHPATDRPRNSPSALPQSEQSPKLPQSCNRNSSDSAPASPSLDRSQPDTSPEESPIPPPHKPEHGPKLSQSYGRNNSRAVDNPQHGSLDSPASRITKTRAVLCGPCSEVAWSVTYQHDYTECRHICPRPAPDTALVLDKGNARAYPSP